MKTTKRFLAFLLCALLLIPLPLAQGETSDANDKIHGKLRLKMEQTDAPLAVIVECSFAVQTLPPWSDDAFDQLVSSVRQELSLEEAPLVLDNQYLHHLVTNFITQWKTEQFSGEEYTVAVLAVWLSHEEIVALASHEKVVQLREVHHAPWIPFQLRTDLDANDALQILQNVVGLREDPLFYGGPDVNMDGMVDVTDALVCLQSCVGLLAIGDVHYVGAIGIPEYWMFPLDWEAERIPRRLFLHATDLNEDGMADELDLYLKYQDRLCAPLI